MLDWHGEHYINGFARIRPSDAKVPILGLESKHIVQIFNNIVYTIWGNELTPLMTKILYTSIGASERTWNSLLESINDYIRKSKRDDIEASGLALYNRLFPIKDALKAMDVKGHKVTSYVLKGQNIIIDLSLLDIKSKIAYAQSLVAYFYNYLRLRKDIDKKVMIFIDEAHNMFPKHRLEIPLPIEEAFIEARKYGLRIILASAYPHKISHTVKFNSTTIIAHQHTNQIDAEDTAKMLALSSYEIPHYAKLLQNLDTGEAIVKHKQMLSLVKVRKN